MTSWTNSPSSPHRGSPSPEREGGYFYARVQEARATFDDCAKVCVGFVTLFLTRRIFGVGVLFLVALVGGCGSILLVEVPHLMIGFLIIRIQLGVSDEFV